MTTMPTRQLLAFACSALLVLTAQAGDEIVAANDLPIAATAGAKLSALMDNIQPGDHLKLRVHRASGEQVVDILVGER